MPELSLTPSQAGQIDELNGIAVDEDSNGTVIFITPDLAEWRIKGDGEPQKTQDAPSLALAEGYEPPMPDEQLSAEIVTELRRPMTAAAVRWKVGPTIGAKANPTGALILPYIDARLVIDRLNLVVPGCWQEGDPKRPNLAPFEFVNVAKGGMLCRLTVCGVCHEDYGEGYGEVKALRSDALKRAAVNHGIGSFLYAIPKVKLSIEEGYVRSWTGNDGKTRMFLTQGGEEFLPKLYTEWLWRHGSQAYGLPLDHGDSAGALGDVDSGAELVPEGTPEEEGDGEPTAAQIAREKRSAAIVGKDKTS